MASVSEFLTKKEPFLISTMSWQIFSYCWRVIGVYTGFDVQRVSVSLPSVGHQNGLLKNLALIRIRKSVSKKQET